MHAVTFNHGDYRLLTQAWWKEWHGTAVSERQLSPVGVAILDNNGPIVIAHLMPAATAPVVWLGFTVSRPSASRLRVGRALKLLLPEAEEATRRMGYEILYTGFDSTALIRLCKESGYFDGGMVREQWKAVK